MKRRALNRGPSAFNIGSLVLGLGFIYLPIVLLIVWSFNASRLVTVWGGFSTRWYGSAFANQQLMDAAWITLRIGLLSATAATVLGVLAAVALAKVGGFRGRTLFSSMIYSPLVMPEVILGLSLLLLFVAVGFDRGFWTVTLAHASFTLSYVTVAVHARLVTFDKALEEAARDLGAPPWKAFLTVTLPNIAPAVVAGWMLAFTLSLDDLVVASFTSGPGATTLPMRIYSQVRLGVSPEINAVCTLLIGLVAVGVIIWSLAMRWQAQREAGGVATPPALGA
jgi:putrescine transport system permease protein